MEYVYEYECSVELTVVVIGSKLACSVYDFVLWLLVDIDDCVTVIVVDGTETITVTEVDLAL